ncbi:MAG: hypothetical protein EZS28_024964 [Streblomastix strix]|uniref:Uncharacterized protein n=1 Tax=Streblomastix strix TaxID=222440 RepID=A0A5J4VAJ1_9EUKA|nr:MAG: hypothetical protein EZS28_024964 [Streblomastix strix]
MLSGLFTEYPNKDCSAFFYPTKNYRPTPIPRPKYLNLSEEQWNLGESPQRGSYIPGLIYVNDGVAGFINIHYQIYQSIPEVVKGLIVFTSEQIVQSEAESKEQEQLTNQIERVVADGTDDNEDSNQSEHAIEPKHFTNGNDGLRKNDSGTQLQATVNGEANSQINITKTSANTPPHNANGSDGLGGNGYEAQLLAATNENKQQNRHAIDNTGSENNNEQTNDNRTGGQQINQGSDIESQLEQDNGNTKLGETGSSHTSNSEQELRNANISQPKGQPTLIITPSELGQVKRKVVVPKKGMQPTIDHDTRSKTDQQKSVPNMPLGSPEARANFDTPNHFAPQQEQRKKADVAPVTEDKSIKPPKATRPVQDSRNRNKNSNSKIRQKQSPIPRLTSRISWTEQE